MSGYFDIWHAVKQYGRNAVDKDKKGVRLTVPLKPLQKPSIDQQKAFALAMDAIAGTKNEKTIPQDMNIMFEVFDSESSDFDALWFRSHCDDFVTNVWQSSGAKAKPGCIYKRSKAKSDRYVEITIEWREVGEFGGMHGILF